MADCTTDFCTLISEAFAAQNDLEILGCIHNGLTALEWVKTLQPDVLIVDAVLPGLDGLRLVRRISEEVPVHKPKVIFVTSIAYPPMFEEAKSLDAQFFMQKPVDMTVLMDRVRSVCKCKAAPVKVAETQTVPLPSPSQSLSFLIAGLLIRSGMPSHLLGYRLLRKAVEIAVYNFDASASVTKLIYPDIAASFAMEQGCVERNIDYAIGKAWMNHQENGNEVMLHCFPGNKRKPSNSEFISAMTGCVALGRFIPEEEVETR